MSEDYAGDVIRAILPVIPTILGAITGAMITYFVNKNKYRLDKSWEMRLQARNSIISNLNLAGMYYRKASALSEENISGVNDEIIAETTEKARKSEVNAHEKFSESYSVLGNDFKNICEDCLIDLSDKSYLSLDAVHYYDVVCQGFANTVKKLEAVRNRDLPRNFR